jgi:hypothetical protein
MELRSGEEWVEIMSPAEEEVNEPAAAAAAAKADAAVAVFGAEDAAVGDDCGGSNVAFECSGVGCVTGAAGAHAIVK